MSTLDWWPTAAFWISAFVIWFSVMGVHVWRVVRRRSVLKARGKLDG